MLRDASWIAKCFYKPSLLEFHVYPGQWGGEGVLSFHFTDAKAN